MAAGDHQQILQQPEVIMIRRQEDSPALNGMSEMNGVFAARQTCRDGLFEVVPALDQQADEQFGDDVVVQVELHGSRSRAISCADNTFGTG
jgi:hypothetical protein